MSVAWNEDPRGEDPSLPAWYLKAREKHQARLRAMEAAAYAPTITIPDRAPGWHEVGMEYSCIPDPQYPWDPQVFKAIQALRPDLTPLWVRWIFLTPPEDGHQETVVFGRHGLGRVDGGVQYSAPLEVTMPNMPCQGMKFERPNRVWKIFEGADDPRAPDLPGAFVPFSWEFYKNVLDSPSLSPKELKYLAVTKPQEDALREQESKLKEREYIQRDLDEFADRLLGRMSEVEMKERLLGGRAPRATRPGVIVGKHA